jgi:hypothetical protein
MNLPEIAIMGVRRSIDRAIRMKSSILMKEYGFNKDMIYKSKREGEEFEKTRLIEIL